MGTPYHLGYSSTLSLLMTIKRWAFRFKCIVFKIECVQQTWRLTRMFGISLKLYAYLQLLARFPNILCQGQLAREM